MNSLFIKPEKSSFWFCLPLSWFLLLIILSCAHQSVPDSEALRRKWVGKPFSAIVDKMGTPDHFTHLPDGEKLYLYQYRPKPIYDDIFRGEFLSDMSTIRIQEELAREEQSKCVLEVLVKDNRIVSLDAPGIGCRDIRERLGE